ncbi:MAG: orotate phosphoribosyltransferase [Planctomyces sp.]|nr:orotate phosphoribosyltransferase [Planctomyces sp.]
MSHRESLIETFRSRALKFGTFTLASGKQASYYLDGKQVTLQSTGLRQVSLAFVELVRDLEFDAVGGMSIGADPLVAGFLTAAAEAGRDLPGFLVRKEPKGHGTQKYIEGPVQPGMKAILLEDVVTTGGSSLLAAERAVEFGMEVVLVAAVVDRCEGGRAAFAARGIEFRSLLTIEDFGIPAPQSA